MRWSDADDEYLRKNWESTSASVIGVHLGRSKNSVLGRAFRQGLPQKDTDGRLVVRNARKPKALVNHKHRARKKERRSESRDRGNLPPPPPYQVSAGPTKKVKRKSDVQRKPYHKTLLELRQHECKWPFGDGPFTFCANATEIGDSYCPYHNAQSSRV